MEYNNNELYHYGVKGMRWGIRRASRQLSKSTSPESRNKAIASLNKHREKGSAEVSKLQKQRPKLDEKLRKATVKDREKAVKLERKAAKLDRKAAKNIHKSGGLLTSKERSKALQDEAAYYKSVSDKLNSKASLLNSNYQRAKANVDTNEMLTQAFKTEIKNIDRILIENGRRYIKN